MKLISARFSDDIIERLDRLSKATGRTKTFYVKEAVNQHLEDLEDIYDAEQALLEIRAGKNKTIPLEDVMRKHGLAG